MFEIYEKKTHQECGKKHYIFVKMTRVQNSVENVGNVA